MKFEKSCWIREVLTSPRRKSLPVMTSPGAALAGYPARELFANGDMQFESIRLLADRVPADMQVTFMDLSVEAEAFGAGVVFSDHENPTVPNALVEDADAIDALQIPAPGAARTAEVLRCAERCAKELERPTLGGVIGPYSLAGRLAGMTEMMILAAAEPETAHALLQKTAAFLKEYLLAMRATGVAGVMIAEPAAGLLSPDMCQEFAADYLRGIMDAVRTDSFMVVLHNCGRTEKQVDALLSSGADALHVGNAVKITDIITRCLQMCP
ncbi:MAG: methylcobamide--CoM methyltransferase [Lentisphaeria bacterium]|nr:methylcobamide--CoM methyltransferase [Lentisphaeria bacterium]